MRILTMSDDREAQLLVAHPGHELLLYGWIRRAKPVVHVLTDGSGHSAASRLGATSLMVDAEGARRGAIFGRLSDRDAYAMILEGNTALLQSVVSDLVTELRQRRATMLVCDTAEGYNPVHDLCRLIAGAAIDIADTGVRQYEYAVVNRPDAFDAAGDDLRFDLDDVTLDAKIEAARRFAAILPDVEELLARHGREAFRHEIFRRVVDWTDLGSGVPEYERFGETRVAAGRYLHVIRKKEHILPLRDALHAFTGKAECVS
ncbi:MAG TPA: hypothetical protein VGQ46_08890 [Thermoanaerobaculia bacterium]|jgi:hypothetical protein|nr:hypothetical protein [Thermoanaerobaculia bacterium]